MNNDKIDNSLFEDVPYNTESTKDDSLFEDVPHPEIAAPRTLASEAMKNPDSPQQDVSPARSALVGAGQGATFGFGEELTAPIVAAAGMVQGAINPEEKIGNLPNESTWEKYQRLMQTYRDVARQEQQAAQEQNPVAYGGGALAGGLLTLKAPIPGGNAIPNAVKAIPGVAKATEIATAAGEMVPTATKIAKGVATGAGYGGVAGLGEGEGSISERLPQAIEGAKTGAEIGGTIPLAGQAIKGTGRIIKEASELPAIKRAIELFKRGVKGEKLYTEAGLKESEQALYNKSEQLYNKIQDIKNEIGKKIGSKLKEADEAGVKIDLTDDINDAFNKLNKLKKTHPGTETTSYINSIKSELKQLFNIKSAENEYMGVPKSELPEGLILPSQPKPTFEVSPTKANEVKQSIFKYTPSYFESSGKAIEPTIVKPLEVGKDIYKGTAQKLEQAFETSTEGFTDNQKYGLIKDTLKRLLTKEKQFSEMDVEKINDMLLKLPKTSSGKNRRLFKWTMNQLGEVDPQIKKQFESEILDATERYRLANDIQNGGGMFSSILGSKKSISGTAANISGLVAGKTGLAATGKAASNFAQTMLNSKLAKNVAQIVPETGVVGVMDKEPYVLQRKVASAAENADPELLKDQAQQIRTKYGQEGEKLAMILDNMSEKDRDARRALMFTVLQNQAYRKMLGLTGETNE